MNESQVPTLEFVIQPWGSTPIGSEEHKSWLLNCILNDTRDFLLQKDVQQLFKQRHENNSWPNSLHFLYDHVEEYNYKLVFDDYKAIMEERGWFVYIQPQGRYWRFETVVIAPMSAKDTTMKFLNIGNSVQ